MFYYKAETAELIADLGIGDLEIEWEWLFQPYVDARKKWVGSHKHLGGKKHRIKIALHYADDAERVRTIAHELRHAWQFARGVCIYGELTGLYNWLGSKFCGPRTDYKRVSGKARLQLPEELDAVGYEHEAYTRLFAGRKLTDEGLPQETVTRRGYPNEVVRLLVKSAMHKPI